MRNQRKQNCYNGTLQRPAVLHEEFESISRSKSKVSVLIDLTNARHIPLTLTPTIAAILYIFLANSDWVEFENATGGLFYEGFLFWTILDYLGFPFVNQLEINLI